jgi:hypothetical protein
MNPPEAGTPLSVPVDGRRILPLSLTNRPFYG